MRHLAIAVMAAMVLGFSPAMAEDAAFFVKAGDSMREKFDNKSALEQYRKAVGLDAENPEIQARLAQALVDNGEDLDSKDSEKFYLEAVEVAGKITAKNPSMAEGHYLSALAYGKLALFRGGKEKVKLSRNVEQSGKKALALDPFHSKARILMGVYYREIANLPWILKKFADTFFGGLPAGSNEDAVRELQKAMELDPRSVRGRFELGKTYEVMGKKKEAIEEFKKAADTPVTDHLDPKWIAESRLRLRDTGGN